LTWVAPIRKAQQQNRKPSTYLGLPTSAPADSLPGFEEKRKGVKEEK